MTTDWQCSHVRYAMKDLPGQIALRHAWTKLARSRPPAGQPGEACANGSSRSVFLDYFDADSATAPKIRLSSPFRNCTNSPSFLAGGKAFYRGDPRGAEGVHRTRRRRGGMRAGEWRLAYRRNVFGQQRIKGLSAFFS